MCVRARVCVCAHVVVHVVPEDRVDLDLAQDLTSRTRGTEAEERLQQHLANVCVGFPLLVRRQVLQVIEHAIHVLSTQRREAKQKQTTKYRRRMAKAA